MHLQVLRASPLTTVQDQGRFGMLQHGIAASGPMDRTAFMRCALALGAESSAGIEFTRAGMAFTLVGGRTRAAFDGGTFQLRHNGQECPWPAVLDLQSGDTVEITPGSVGNYGYVRLLAEIDVPLILGSRSTNSIAGLGGFGGRALAAGDLLPLINMDHVLKSAAKPALPDDGQPIRVLWGAHADLFPATVRDRFLATSFEISGRLDRMGVRLIDREAVFRDTGQLTLVSEAIVPGDVQILGDGTPIVLMRDHQPTGGYPRIATVIGADLDRFAQRRPGSTVRFTSVTPDRAHKAALSR